MNPQAWSKWKRREISLSLLQGRNSQSEVPGLSPIMHGSSLRHWGRDLRMHRISIGIDSEKLFRRM